MSKYSSFPYRNGKVEQKKLRKKSKQSKTQKSVKQRYGMMDKNFSNLSQMPGFCCMNIYKLLKSPVLPTKSPSLFPFGYACCRWIFLTLKFKLPENDKSLHKILNPMTDA